MKPEQIATINTTKESGHCANCNHPIERQRMEAPDGREISTVDPTEVNPLRKQWYEYYANNTRIWACPACHMLLPPPEYKR